MSSSLPHPAHPGAAILSALLPGSGQIFRRQWAQAAITVGIGGLLAGCTWWVRSIGGTEAAIFFGMIFILPWWAIQSYEASLSTPPGLRGTLKIIWERAHDIRYLGALFFLATFTDLYIILANPDYRLPVFCTKPSGIGGILAKAQSPLSHLAIGYGFLRLRRWSLFVYMAYAGFGILNATINYACLGYGRIRTVFLVSLIGFTLYVTLRRHCFQLAQNQGETRHIADHHTSL